MFYMNFQQYLLKMRQKVAILLIKGNVTIVVHEGIRRKIKTDLLN